MCFFFVIPHSLAEVQEFWSALSRLHRNARDAFKVKLKCLFFVVLLSDLFSVANFLISIGIFTFYQRMKKDLFSVSLNLDLINQCFCSHHDRAILTGWITSLGIVACMRYPHGCPYDTEPPAREFVHRTRKKPVITIKWKTWLFELYACVKTHVRHQSISGAITACRPT